jgi:hypothetical protein
MGTSYNPPIVTDGLVFCVDAANQRSYPKSGTTWSDLAGANDGTLTNMTFANNFSSDNGGVFTFDGSDESVDCGNPGWSASYLTVTAWIYITTGSRYQHIVDSSGNIWHLAILNSNRPYFATSAGYHTGAPVLDNNKWYMLTGRTRSSGHDIIINTSIGQTITSNVQPSTNNLKIGHWQNGGRFFAGKIANTLIYNRSLTDDEVRQNYEATVGRFT